MPPDSKVLIEVELGKKAVERTDIFVYLNGKLAESHFDVSYNDLSNIADSARDKYKGAQIEAWCVGEDCMGGLHRWQVKV